MLPRAPLFQALRSRRRFSVKTVPESLLNWASSDKSLKLSDQLTTDRLSDLYITLPTRDGVRSLTAFQPPRSGDPLPYGHHLVFCRPRNPESQLRPNDGTDNDFCPPEPFTRRMWAGGKFTWNNKSPLKIGGGVDAITSVSKDSIAFKGFGTELPMIFVNQKIELRQSGHASYSDVALVEERRHVYLSSRASVRKARVVEGIPERPDFHFEYTPTPTTLFRFSALTFNGHYIHLDREYAQQVEGYSERLVHGPLSALMLLETLFTHHPELKLESFDYRAHNPIIVNQPISIYGYLDLEKGNVHLWCTTSEGVVGMTGVARIA